jgi:hypothetical protein
MKKYLKRLFGIKDYLVCPTCKMVYEPDGQPFDDWCPEHRKPYQEQHALEEWAKGWARRNPEDAKKARTLDQLEMRKSQNQFVQNMAQAQADALQRNQMNAGFSNIFGSQFKI